MTNKFDKEKIDKETMLEANKIKQELGTGMLAFGEDHEKTKNKIDKKLNSLKTQYQANKQSTHHIKKKKDE